MLPQYMILAPHIVQHLMTDERSIAALDVAERFANGKATDGDIETALLFGTLKALPALNFETIDTFWIENGVTVHIKQAA